MILPCKGRGTTEGGGGAGEVIRRGGVGVKAGRGSRRDRRGTGDAEREGGKQKNIND